jgi:hypothetical protein
VVAKAASIVRSRGSQPSCCQEGGYPSREGGPNGKRGSEKGGSSDAQPRDAKVAREWWLREAINDGDGQADIAYVVIGALAISAITAQAFIMVMSVVSYVRCTRIVDVGQNVRAAVACSFDPLPLGQASGLIFAAFAALIGAFAGYMAATRRQSRQAAAGKVTATASAGGA